MLVLYPSSPLWRRGIVLGAAIAIGILVAIKIGGEFGSKPEANQTKPQSYKASLGRQFNEIKDFMICGTLYITFFGHNESCAYQRNPQEEGPKATDWLLVVIGVLQFWIYVRQARILNRQTEIASDTLRFVSTQDRPYILIADLQTVARKRTGNDSGYEREAVAHLINAGKTPAIVHSIEFERLDYRRLETPPGYENIYSVHCVVVPDGKPLKVGFPIWASSSNPMASIFFYIRVRYADVFGRFWATAFAYKLDWRDGPSRIGGKAFNNDHREKEEPNYWPGEGGLSPPFSYRLRQELRIIWIWLKTRRLRFW